MAAHAQRQFVVAQRLPGVGCGVGPHIFGRALGHDEAARIAAFRPQVDEPVAGADHVQVVLDDDERVPRIDELAQRAHELGNVIKVQAGGGLVEQEQRALARHSLTRFGSCLRRLGQEACQLEALGLTARQGRHGLAQRHVFEPHVHDGLQRADHVAVVGKHRSRLGHGEGQHIGHVQRLAAALDGDLQDLGAVALAVAVGAAQVHVAQELHLHMLKARAAAGGAAPVAAVEAEFGGGVAALLGQRRHGEQLADAVPRAHVAHGVGARCLADGRLVYKHHVRQMIRAQHAVVRAGRVGGLAKVPQQRGRQHVLDQAGLARAAHARHGDQALQRKFDRHILQVVFACTFKDEAWGRFRHHALEAEAHMLAPAQVGARQGVGLAQIRRGAVEHDLPAQAARAGAHVNHAVGREHDGRVVLHHHQGVARIAQAQHGLGDAVHVARVQADAGLVQHKQRVDQAGAQGRGQVDALHLAAAQRAALAVECEVANAHVAQVLQACGDLFVQQFQRLRVAAFGVVPHR